LIKQLITLKQIWLKIPGLEYIFRKKNHTLLFFKQSGLFNIIFPLSSLFVILSRINIRFSFKRKSRLLFSILQIKKDTEFFRTKSVAVLLMNKLFEEKRYNAVVDTYKQISCGGGSGRLIPEAVELMFDALVEKAGFNLRFRHIFIILFILTHSILFEYRTRLTRLKWPLT
jgi:hypothetical protein